MPGAGPSSGTTTDGTPPAITAPAVSAAGIGPSFDVVRVEPSGEAVIAGRGEPGADVALMDGSQALAHVKIDPSGQFALLPPTLAEGSHYLTLQVQGSGKAPVSSGQGVAVTVAKGGAARPLVALLSPDKPAQILSDGAPVGGVPASAGPAGTATGSGVPQRGGTAGSTPMAIQAVEAAEGGKFTATGVAHAGNQCRVYLNGAYLADVTAGKDGRWSIEVKKGMKPGRYTVRADELESGSGKVVSRAEVPFDYPATVIAGKAKNLLMARGKAGKGALVSATVPGAGGAPTTRMADNTVPGAGAADALGSGKTTASRGQGSVASKDAAGKATLAGGGATSRGVAGTDASSQTVASTASGSTAVDAAGAGSSGVVIADLSTATVVRGDSLWRISRKMLGHGVQYTEIYASNASQIRDPKLIYPGQVFVVPNRQAN